MTTPKNTTELRKFLLDQMSLVATGEQEPMQAKAICNYAQQVYNTVNLEIKYAVAKNNIGDEVISPVSLSNE